jgi:hypothetical protein
MESCYSFTELADRQVKCYRYCYEIKHPTWGVQNYRTFFLVERWLQHTRTFHGIGLDIEGPCFLPTVQMEEQILELEERQPITSIISLAAGNYPPPPHGAVLSC